MALEGALDRGDLRYPRFLPLVARESPREYHAWALRWVARWTTESNPGLRDFATTGQQGRYIP